jgi:hypothetical protein
MSKTTLWQPRLCDECAAEVIRQTGMVAPGTETSAVSYCKHGTHPVLATMTLHTGSIAKLCLRGPCDPTEAAVIIHKLDGILAAQPESHRVPTAAERARMS